MAFRPRNAWKYEFQIQKFRIHGNQAQNFASRWRSTCIQPGSQGAELRAEEEKQHQDERKYTGPVTAEG
jgi:hypothetical protein